MKKNNSFVHNKPLLVCSDLDKTLVGLRDFISERDLKALEFLQQKKVPLVFASGRCLSRITGLLAKYNLLLPHNSYLVGNNGGLIFNNDQQKVISENVFEIATVQKIFALAKKLRCHLFARTSYDSLVNYSSGSRCSVFF